jgi:hypothetical protein
MAENGKLHIHLFNIIILEVTYFAFETHMRNLVLGLLKSHEDRAL